jgi:hypothetical protein
MATRAFCTPFAAEPPASNAAPPGMSSDASGRRPYLSFDQTTEQAAYWTVPAPQGLTGALTAVITYMAAGTSGGVAFGVSVEAVSDGDATDLDAGESYDAENVGTVASVPGTAGHPDQLSVTLTNADNVAAGDYVRVRLARKVGNAADTLAAAALVLSLELRDAA